MLFRKKMLRSCEYCVYATRLNDEEVLCIKRGVRGIDKACRKFTYDPYKRIPARPKAPAFDEYKEETFSL